MIELAAPVVGYIALIRLSYDNCGVGQISQPRRVKFV